jgi:SAM-dependent methyltransferase
VVLDSVMWHDLECGTYAADLELWRELTQPSGGDHLCSVLDVGAGSGRVTLDLARRGRHVTALDLDGDLLAALRERAGDLDVQTVCADARTFELERRDFAVCLMPMQTVQLLGGEDGRIAFLRCARAHVVPGGVIACAIVTELDGFDCAAGDEGPTPEIASIDDAHYVSRATRVDVGRWRIRIERERSVITEDQRRSSAPSVREREVVVLEQVTAAQLHRDGRAAGLTSTGTRAIPATAEHVGSEVVMFRA